ncbi:MAG TPA: DUF2244 domain-containing protein [Rhizomicrobium sp.]|nr:DUF2244 domain-containing protein [Rhizomicrobium sp.]
MDRQGDILFDAVLRPNPPLGPRPLAVILGVVAAVNLIFAASFVARGAWPIAPFMGLDVALLAWAFRTSVAASRREEQLTLTPSALTIVRRPGPGEVVLNPYWVRVEMEEPPASRLTLWSHGKGVRIAACVGAAERARVAQALKEALWRVRNSLP